MMGRMNKHINSLSMRNLLQIEQQEHGLKKTPTMKQAEINEMKEHGLKGVPSAAKVRAAEAIEHGSTLGKLVIKGNQQARAKASEAYRAG
jgi:hypothetical protein